MEIVTVICESCDNGYHIRSPLVGAYNLAVREGSLVNNQSQCGYIDVLGQKYQLEIPSNAQGVVKNVTSREGVGYGDLLFTLQKLTTLEGENQSEEKEGVTQGDNVVIAPTDGMFYRRPTPDEPAYVEVGSTVKEGQVLGLVEVMKTFNQILYSGENLPKTATIREICIEDGAEVRNQQVLFIVDAFE